VTRSPTDPALQTAKETRRGLPAGPANTRGFEGDEDEAEEDEAEDADVAADHPFAVPGDDAAAEGEALAGWAEPEKDGGWALLADGAGGMGVMHQKAILRKSARETRAKVTGDPGRRGEVEFALGARVSKVKPGWTACDRWVHPGVGSGFNGLRG
jgi:hypothetical protein